ncbi:unnamed protein product [Brassicogethes aeneus]|uniref:Protein transport protein Sec24A n=1 Tax=Brassicogethes aeneus TaxID=1431903 RepID=A0A9P0FL58_BRAAE|nr:unnamed protein product [Brassicogethes aeneus]
MSQSNMTDQNIPNGIPPQFQMNGAHSSQSSRDPSPLPRLGTIPMSQLPPGRAGIPSNQLPASRSPITTLTQKVGQMNVTPNISPKFSTSTPNQPAIGSAFVQNSAFSPISSNPVSNRTPVLENVPLNSDKVSATSMNPVQGQLNKHLTSQSQQRSSPQYFNGSQQPQSQSSPNFTQKPAQNPNLPNYFNNPSKNSMPQLGGQLPQNNFTPQSQNHAPPLGRPTMGIPPQNNNSAPPLGRPTTGIPPQNNVTPSQSQNSTPPLQQHQFGGPSASLPPQSNVPPPQTQNSIPPLQQHQFGGPSASLPPQSNVPPPQTQNSIPPLQQHQFGGPSASLPPQSNVPPPQTQNSISPLQQHQFGGPSASLPPQSNVPPPQTQNSISPLQQHQFGAPSASLPPQNNVPLPQTQNFAPPLQQNQFGRPTAGPPLNQGPQNNITPPQSQTTTPPVQQNQFGKPSGSLPPQSNPQPPMMGQNQFGKLNTAAPQNLRPSMPQPVLNSFPQQKPPMSNLAQHTRPPNANFPPQPQQNQFVGQPQQNSYYPPSNMNFNNNQARPPMPQQPQNYVPPQTIPQIAATQNVPLKNPLFNNRYPAAQVAPQPQMGYKQQQQQTEQQPNYYPTKAQYPATAGGYDGVVQSGFGKFWGTENYDLLQTTNILPPVKVEAPLVHLGKEALDNANCSPEILRCTLTKIPENNGLLQKSRLPLGVLIHPFKDLNHLPVIQCNVIVRCRTCRTYINPFVYFVDNKRWKCNLCYRINELPEEFQYDPVSKSYGDPSRRPEIKASTIEYIAPQEYMLRPPQPAVYLFLLDVSRMAVESGYLVSVCSILLEELKNLPGDARTQIGFIAYDSALHFFSLAEGLSQPHEMTVLDVDDIFLPCPDNLLVNMKDRMDLVTDLLGQLPTRYNQSYDTNSALGAALQAAYKMMSATGGRVTVFQAALPNVGPGALAAREDPSQRATVEVNHLNPANDFYKRLALECSGQQIAVDLFVLNSQYVDIATVSGISRFSGGCMHHYPLFKSSRTLQSESFERCFKRYLTRKIGFESVMRIRCTRGLAIHTFHGNFFVRSTDLLSLPNINPDAGFGMQVSIEESLSDVQTVCFQAALLYTSSKGERRIRVHTLCLPVVSTLQDVINSADQQCIVGLLSKMAVDRSMQANLSDAREAFINVAIDILSSYKFSLNLGDGQSGLMAPNCLKLLPLYISALLKHTAFRTGTTTRLDDRVKAMMDMKSKPLHLLIQQIYPDLYPIHDLENQQMIVTEEETIPMPPRLQLSARLLDNSGAFLMDTGEHMILLIAPNCPRPFLNDALGVADYDSITEQMYEIPTLDNPRNQRLLSFVNFLNEEKPFVATLQVLRDNSANRHVFFERLVEDRVENALSYHEFLQHLRTQVK